MPKTRDKLLQLISNRIPILNWGRTYNTQKFGCDLIAGTTVALTVMPQALAYATLAGLEPQYGLYSAFMGCFIYCVFGSCKDITIGPTALMALMTYEQIKNRNIDYSVLLCFLSGVVQMIMAVLHLGVLIDFISVPVTIGFTSATSVIIASSQMKSLLGLKFESNDFLDTWTNVFKNIHQTRYQDLTLGLVCIIILLFLRKLKDIKLWRRDFKETQKQKYISRVFWIISTSRNALVVIFCSIVACIFININGEAPFLLTGTVKQGLPDIGLPPFSTVLNNRTVEFGEMVSDLGISIVLVPVIAVLGNVAIAKAFASENGVDATQELFTLSLCNIVGSFFSSMPITGSFSRSAVNHVSGVLTPFGGVYTGVLVLLALSFLTPYFAFIPKAALAAVIICAVIFMIEYEVLKPMWRSSKKDLIPAFATFIICLAVGVEIGILIGVGINILFLLYPSARPTISVQNLKTDGGVEYIHITPGNSLYFPAVDFIKSSVGKAGMNSSHLPVVLDCRHILGTDFTAAKGISSLLTEFTKRKQLLYFLNPKENVIAVFKGVVEENLQFIYTEEELDHLLRENLRENNRLLQIIDTNGVDFEGQLTEPNEVRADIENTTINHRRI